MKSDAQDNMRYWKFALIFVLSIAVYIAIDRSINSVQKNNRLEKELDEQKTLSLPEQDDQIDEWEFWISSPDINLKQLAEIDTELRNRFGDEYNPYSIKLASIRAVLLCLSRSSHTDVEIRNVISLHSYNLSSAQSRILQDYLDGGSITKDRWERAGRISSLSNFDKIINHEN